MAFQFIIFDLDDTLYPRDSGLMQEIGRRIQAWLCDYLGLTWDEAVARRREYYTRYGTTMSGLMVEHRMDPHDYLAFVHDIPIERYLDPSPALAAMLDAIPLQKAIYTNATSEYGRRVLRALDLVDRFEQVIGIEEVGLRNKFDAAAYEQALALLNARGHECIMVEDTVGNLQPAKKLGLTTVLVDEHGPMAQSGAPAVGPSKHEVDRIPDEHVDFVVGSVLQVEQVVRRLLRRGPQPGT